MKLILSFFTKSDIIVEEFEIIFWLSCLSVLNLNLVIILSW